MQVSSQEKIMNKACVTAKLPAGVACEFDMPGESAEWKNGFQAWHTSANEEAKLNWLGAYIVGDMMRGALAVRARQIHAWQKMPDLESTPINRPIFILGMHRTGSTLLHNLLSRLEGLRAPLHYEYTVPMPGDGEAPDENIKTAKQKVDEKQDVLPGIEHVHVMEFDMPEECILQMMQSMEGLVPLFSGCSSMYQKRMMSRTLNVDHMMRHHRRNLQWFQATAGDATPRRWLLKAPFWATHIKDIEKFYPDAVFIMTHRAPHRCIGSISSLIAKWRGLFSDEVDFTNLGPDQVSMGEEMLRRMMEARRRWKEDPSMAGRFFDVHLADLAKDPLGTVEKLAGLVGEKVSAESHTIMKEWLATGQVHAGKHPVNLTDFGLSTEAMLANPVFTEYCQEFGVAEC